MTILQRYIAKIWLTNLIGSVSVLYLIFTIATLVSGFMRTSVTPMQVMLNHFLETPDALKKIFPIACLVSSLFCIDRLKAKNELTACLSIGFSHRKFLFVIGLCGLSIAALQFFNTGFLHAKLKSKRFSLITENRDRFKNLRSLGLSASTMHTGRVWFKGENYFLSYDIYDKRKSEILDLQLTYFDLAKNLITQQIFAKKLSFIDNRWLLQEPIILSSWEKSFQHGNYEKKQTGILNLDLHPKDLADIEADISVLNVFQLKEYINKLEKNGINTDEYSMMFYDHFSSAIICLIFTLIATQGIHSPNRRQTSVGKNLAITFIFALLYWLIYSYTYELGKSSRIPPELASFIVPILGMLVFIFSNRKKT
jgi:lipopolysaccharide export system permease protein